MASCKTMVAVCALIFFHGIQAYPPKSLLLAILNDAITYYYTNVEHEPVADMEEAALFLERTIIRALSKNFIDVHYQITVDGHVYPLLAIAFDIKSYPLINFLLSNGARIKDKKNIKHVLKNMGKNQDFRLLRLFLRKGCEVSRVSSVLRGCIDDLIKIYAIYNPVELKDSLLLLRGYMLGYTHKDHGQTEKVIQQFAKEEDYKSLQTLYYAALIDNNNTVLNFLKKVDTHYFSYKNQLLNVVMPQVLSLECSVLSVGKLLMDKLMCAPKDFKPILFKPAWTLPCLFYNNLFAALYSQREFSQWHNEGLPESWSEDKKLYDSLFLSVKKVFGRYWLCYRTLAGNTKKPEEIPWSRAEVKNWSRGKKMKKLNELIEKRKNRKTPQKFKNFGIDIARYIMQYVALDDI